MTTQEIWKALHSIRDKANAATTLAREYPKGEMRTQRRFNDVVHALDGLIDEIEDQLGEEEDKANS